MSKKMQSLSITCLCYLALLVFVGCASSPERMDAAPQRPYTQDYQPREPLYVPTHADEGSLWTDSANTLFVDNRARRVGDTVTIEIVENTSSSIEANTKADRNSGIEAGIENFLGYFRALEEKNRNFNRDQSGALTENTIKANMKNFFTGKGSSDRSGTVTASVGARVTEVLPNGNLLVWGSREMKVNNEMQIITVSGIIRPVDISPDNRIQSVFLADARIQYYGKGVLADKQKPGWGTRILDHVWPF